MRARVPICAFRGAASFPLLIALEDAHFARHGLDVELLFTGSSDELVDGLLRGVYAVVQAAPDNFVAWRARTGRPIVAWYGASSGPISLVIRPELDGIDGLRGASIAVDFPDAGWAPILVGVLARHGVARDEISQVATGATAKVFAALVEGRTPAAMLNEPWATRATTQGCRIVTDHRTVAPRLQTSAGASLATWLAEDPHRAESVLRAIVAATTWILDPANRDQATRRLATHLDSEPGDVALVLDRMTTPGLGWPPSAYPDVEGFRAVCDLRAGVGDPPTEAPEAHVTYDVYRRVFGFPTKVRP
jgi:NitT/TauT family transport system substrate-binding protein